jgi:hypothetical protein
MFSRNQKPKSVSRMLPNLIFCTFLAGIIGVSVGFSLYTRGGFLDGDGLMRSFDEIPYYLNYRPNAAYFDPDVNEPSIDSVEELRKNADLIALITPTDNRESAQYAIVTDAVVTEVLKGDVHSGGVIRVLEPIRLERLSDEQSNEVRAAAQEEEARYRAFVDGSYTNGFTPLQTSSDYLVFLKRVEPSSIDGVPTGEVVYIVLNSPYSRIGVDGSASVFIASDHGGRYVLARDVRACNLIVPDKESAEAYQANSALLLSEFFGANPREGEA